MEFLNCSAEITFKTTFNAADLFHEIAAGQFTTMQNLLAKGL